MLLLDEFARVEYASPNAVSALHRIGIHSNLEGARLSELGLDESPVRVAFAIGLPITEEMERGPVTLILRAIPLIEHPKLSGAVVLLRDVSELRRRDRLLISKDATIREVHHRVKNNLQTISALLRLQGRRLESPEAIAAIEESVRRIRSIALVHETLSRASGEEVEFNEIVRPLARMVEEGLLSPDHPVRITVDGDAGELRAEVATPLAVVLTELLQNAVQHAFPEDAVDPPADPQVRVTIEHEGGELVVRVHDNGVGPPPGFSVDDATSLGLTIVRALVTTELAGTIAMHTDEGTLVDLRIPVLPTCEPYRWVAPRDGGARRPTGQRRGAADEAAGAPGLGGAALAGEPGLAELAALVLVGAAPHAGLLVGGEGELEAGALHLAVPAHELGRRDLLDGGPGAPHGEEQVGVGVTAGGLVSPVVGVPLEGTAPGECHGASRESVD